jgi:hypothetical protein
MNRLQGRHLNGAGGFSVTSMGMEGYALGREEGSSCPGTVRRRADMYVSSSTRCASICPQICIPRMWSKESIQSLGGVAPHYKLQRGTVGGAREEY